ncbi:uncharacterized protein LOC144123195 [Amblyomma americanum]
MQADAATIGPKVEADSQASSAVANLDLVKKAGKSVEALGKILSGELSSLTNEDQESVLEALTALTASEGEFDPESEEYFWATLLQKAFVWAVQQGVSTGVSKGVSAAINKG